MTEQTFRQVFRQLRDLRTVSTVQLGGFGEPLTHPRGLTFWERVRRFDFSLCLDCGGCELRESNEEDCFGDEFPRGGDGLWAAGLVPCP